MLRKVFLFGTLFLLFSCNVHCSERPGEQVESSKNYASLPETVRQALENPNTIEKTRLIEEVMAETYKADRKRWQQKITRQ